MSEELKPCPFCGSTTSLILGSLSELFDSERDGFKVVCSCLYGGCGASSGQWAELSEVMSAWNTRPDDHKGEVK